MQRKLKPALSSAEDDEDEYGTTRSKQVDNSLPRNWLSATGVYLPAGVSFSEQSLSNLRSSSYMSSDQEMGEDDSYLGAGAPQGFNGKIEGWVQASVGSCGHHCLKDRQEDILERLPVADESWKLCLAQLDALNLNLYEENQNLWLRCDVYDAGRSVTSAQPEVLTFTFTDGLGRRKRVFLKLRSEKSCYLWIEALYQARACRRTWTLTPYPNLEMGLCCCAFGNNILSHIFWFVVCNFTNVMFDLSDLLWTLFFDIAKEPNDEPRRRLQIEISFINNGVLLIASFCMLAVLYSSQRPMHVVLRRTRILCFALALASLGEIIVSLVSLGEHDEFSRAMQKRLLSVVDVMLFVTWLNGAYLCTRGLAILKQDITDMSLCHV
mmetsp:Transcript_19720/g.38572  ORF Transcript_19720/g.38572 Transcript_19720/m.38572 type:complete len:380 (-) Transcript_19720:190-1329(-)